MSKFFMWNNGRSVWNIDRIIRMVATDYGYYVTLDNDKEYKITAEEYGKLAAFIDEREKTK